MEILTKCHHTTIIKNTFMSWTYEPGIQTGLDGATDPNGSGFLAVGHFAMGQFALK